MTDPAPHAESCECEEECVSDETLRWVEGHLLPDAIRAVIDAQEGEIEAARERLLALPDEPIGGMVFPIVHDGREAP